MRIFPRQNTTYLLVGVAKNLTLGIEQLANLDRRRNGPEVDLEIERDVDTAAVGEVRRCGRATDLVETVLEVLLLPLPVDVVDHAVVEIEEGVWNGGVSE